MSTASRRSEVWKAYGWLLLAVGLAVGMGGPAVSEQRSPNGFQTNEAYVQDVEQEVAFDIKDSMAVLRFVLASLRDRVTVYPTENYYYFKFVHGGVPYAGNLRLDPRNRDEGKIYFGYYEERTDGADDVFGHVLLLGSEHKVTVERVENLLYRVTFEGRSVLFALNDVSNIKPPLGIVGPDERLIGPVFDESAVRFFLVFNAKAKVFHFILDETTAKPTDVLERIKQTDRILVGKRTGFAYYRDHKIERKILIGVSDYNATVNNYFDGPFDQLPENFIEGETLRQAIIESEPEIKGQIDRLGHLPDGETRYAITPYMQYRAVGDLAIFHRCATDRRVPAAAYYRCFAIDSAGPQSAGRPLALIDLGRRKR